MKHWKKLSNDVAFREWVQWFPLTCGFHLPQFQLPVVNRGLKILNETFQNEAIHKQREEIPASGSARPGRQSAHVQGPHLAAGARPACAGSLSAPQTHGHRIVLLCV